MSHGSFRLGCVALCFVMLCTLASCSILPETSHPEQTTASTTITTATTKTTTTTTTTTTTKKTTTTTKPTTTKPTTIQRAPSSTTTRMPNTQLADHILSVPIIAQFPEFPTGCESVSAVMALRYYGETISVTEFVNTHLSKDDRFWWESGVLRGPDPYKYFVGDPATENSYGCMAPVIEKALVSFFGSDERVINTTGESLSSLCSTYIDQGIPVLVWATIGMVATEKGTTWKLSDGSSFSWPKNEHCMVLIGYDDNRYYFNDPYRGTVKSYGRALCESRYKDLGMQSIAITK